MSDHPTRKVYPIQDWLGYFITKRGDVYSLRNGKWKKLKWGGKRYPSVTLCTKGRLRRICVHRLVLETFRGPCPEGMEACHNNGDGWNNRLSNLRWDTHKNNIADRNKHGGTHRGSENGNSKFKETEVLEICRMYDEEGLLPKIIAKKMNMTTNNVVSILSGITWSHLTGRDNSHYTKLTPWISRRNTNLKLLLHP